MSVRSVRRSFRRTLRLGVAVEETDIGAAAVDVGEGPWSREVRQAAQVSETSARVSRTGLKDDISPACSFNHYRVDWLAFLFV